MTRQENWCVLEVLKWEIYDLIKHYLCLIKTEHEGHPCTKIIFFLHWNLSQNLIIPLTHTNSLNTKSEIGLLTQRI